MSLMKSFGEPPELDGLNLLCPSCGGNNLHQQHTTVATRPREDALGVVFTVSAARSAVSPATEDSYVGRRGDICIAFSCEECGDGTRTLVIQQHKGSTLVWWKPL